jgi:hypothetical protein
VSNEFVVPVFCGLFGVPFGIEPELLTNTVDKSDDSPFAVCWFTNFKAVQTWRLFRAGRTLRQRCKQNNWAAPSPSELRSYSDLREDLPLLGPHFERLSPPLIQHSERRRPAPSAMGAGLARYLAQVVSEPIFDIPRLVEAACHQRFDPILSGGSPERSDACIPPGTELDVRRQASVDEALDSKSSRRPRCRRPRP